MTEKFIRVDSVNISERTIEVSFTPSEEMSRYFAAPYTFRSEYSEDVSATPASIGVIPFLSNVLPVAWLADATIYLPELDSSFYNEAIPNIRAGYAAMYPMKDFRGNIKPNSLTNNILPPPSSQHDSAMCLFSGGVDAYCTLYRHLEERPRLLTVWGADIKLTDTEGWNVVNAQNLQAARKFGLELDTVKSNFRTFINYRPLEQLVAGSGDGYWHGFQHGIGLIGLAAPLTWLHGVRALYIASSYTAADRGKYTCASDPTIDNHMTWAQTHTVHDGYELTRQQKVHLICTESERLNLHPELRVCWVETGGHNCCRCEKCCRTLFELIAEGRNPREYGFDYKDRDMNHSKSTVLAAYSRTIAPAWREISDLIGRMPPADVPGFARWVIGCDFAAEAPHYRRRHALATLPRRALLRLCHLLRRN